jgi:hypothetical protein
MSDSLQNKNTAATSAPETYSLSTISRRGAAGLLEGVSEQGFPVMLGSAISYFSPKLLKRLAYGKPGSDDTAGVYNLVDKLTDAHISQGGSYHPETAVNVAPKNTANYYPKVWSKKNKEWLAESVTLPSNATPETVAHEIGHLSPKSMWAKKLRSLADIAVSKKTRLLPAGLALSGAIPGLEPVSDAAPYIGGLQLATMLGDEAYANIRGAKLLEAIGHKMPIHKKLRMFLPTISYLGQAATLVGLPWGINKGIKAYNKSKEKGQPLTYREMLAATPQVAAELPTYQEFKNKWDNRLK